MIDKDEFKKQIDEWIRVRREEGIPLIKPVVDDLLDISKRAGIAFKER